jgi:hypothetical protein
MGQNSGGGFSAAPSAVSDMLRQHIKFGGTGEALSLHGLIAVANVGQTAAGGASADGLVDGSSNAFTGIRLSPTRPSGTGFNGAAAIAIVEFVSPALDLLGSAFTRYKVKKLKFHYRPQSGSNSTQQLVFAFAADPIHPLVTPLSGALNTSSGLESLSDSIPFAPWAAWSMDVSSKLDSGPWQYTEASDDTESTDGAFRLDCFGSIGLTAASTVSASVNYGVLYMEFSMDFKEFCPISVTRPSLTRLAQKIISNADKAPAKCLGKDSICSVESVSSFPSPTFQSDTKVIDLAEMVNKTQEIRKLRSDVTLEAALKAVLKDRTPTVEALRLIHESGLSHILMCEDADHDVPVSMGFTKICKDAYKIQMG